MAELGELTLQSFTGYLGDPFRLAVVAAEGPVSPPSVEVRMIEAVALGEAAQAGFRAPFSIMFSGAAGSILPQGMYRLEHERLDPIELFLVPLEPDAEGARYQAIFN